MSIKNKSTERPEKWIESQNEQGYFTRRNDKLAELKLAIDEGLESGVSSESVKEIMENVEKKLAENGKL